MCVCREWITLVNLLLMGGRNSNLEANGGRDRLERERGMMEDEETWKVRENDPERKQRKIQRVKWRLMRGEQ